MLHYSKKKQEKKRLHDSKNWLWLWQTSVRFYQKNNLSFQFPLENHHPYHELHFVTSKKILFNGEKLEKFYPSRESHNEVPYPRTYSFYVRSTCVFFSLINKCFMEIRKVLKLGEVTSLSLSLVYWWTSSLVRGNKRELQLHQLCFTLVL